MYNAKIYGQQQRNFRPFAICYIETKDNWYMGEYIGYNPNTRKHQVYDFCDGKTVIINDYEIIQARQTLPLEDWDEIG